MRAISPTLVATIPARYFSIGNIVLLFFLNAGIDEFHVKSTSCRVELATPELSCPELEVSLLDGGRGRTTVVIACADRAVPIQPGFIRCVHVSYACVCVCVTRDGTLYTFVVTCRDQVVHVFTSLVQFVTIIATLCQRHQFDSPTRALISRS